MNPKKERIESDDNNYKQASAINCGGLLYLYRFYFFVLYTLHLYTLRTLIYCLSVN